MPNLVGFMLARGKIRERFLERWNPITESQAPRNIIRGVPRPVISPVAGVMTTTATGLDNSASLPPFVPSGRGEDTLFGFMAQKCFPDIYMGYVPIALLHCPEQEKPYEPLGSPFKLADILMMILDGCPSAIGPTVKDRLEVAGKYFIECGLAAHGDFEDYVLSAARRRIAMYLESCERYLRDFNAEPTHWAQAMRSWKARLELQLVSPDAGAPADVPTVEANGDRYAVAQRFVLKFGELLRTWPAIIEATLSLRSAGYGIGQGLT
jgi:hypothetical protein